MTVISFGHSFIILISASSPRRIILIIKSIHSYTELAFYSIPETGRETHQQQSADKANSSHSHLEQE